MLRCGVGLREHRPCCRRQRLTLSLPYNIYHYCGGTACVIECRGRVDKSVNKYARFALISKAYRISDGGVRDDATPRCRLIDSQALANGDAMCVQTLGF